MNQFATALGVLGLLLAPALLLPAVLGEPIMSTHSAKDAPPVRESAAYQESLRPQFHFTAAANWLNDPNGLVFYAAEYHLFFQHNPRGLTSGNLTWGHAVSPDLVHWTQLANALAPDELGPIWSGSAVVDWDNTAGLQRGSERTLVALYTAAGGTSAESKGRPFTQCLAYSVDRGRSWTKYAHNPVLPALPGKAVHDARDPKVVWHAPTRRWVMALYKSGNTYGLFASPDLKAWTPLQELVVPDCGECPDFFPMRIDGDPAVAPPKWVFTAANAKYLVGAFDGRQFTPEQELRQVDFGRNFYAVQTFSDVPTSDGRRIQIAWMRDGKYPNMPFNQQTSFPRELVLKRTPDELRLFAQPAREIESLRGQRHAWADVMLTPDGEDPLAQVSGDLFEIVAEFEPRDAEEFGFRVRGEPIIYSMKAKQLSALGSAPLELDHGRLKLRVLIDRTSLETFANDGRVSLSSCFVPDPADKRISVFTKAGTTRVISLVVYDMQSAWAAAPAARH